MSYGPRPWLQTHWDVRAAANFILGGTGAGLLVAWALVAPASPDWRLYAIGGGALIAGGLAAVWLEIGRKLRALNVLLNPRTSWMTRESYAAVLLFILIFSALIFDKAALAAAAALVALVFLWCQARILRASKGIPAWRVPQLGALVIATGLAEGAALFALTHASPLAVALAGLAVIGRALAWSRYQPTLQGPAREALEPAGRMLLQLGTVAALVLLLAAVFVPAAAVLAAAAIIAAGWRFKLVLVTRAASNQGFALPRLPVRGAR
jgi:phenylacetyl-CoA:acceptor oxidoreductase 26-kDa subunit